MLKRLWPLVAACLVAASLTVPAGPADKATAAAAGKHPNVVFILTDDMRLDDMRYMPFTRRLMRKTGTTFTHALSPHPLCCPARAELATGQYAQNNGVLHNHGEWGGFQALRAQGGQVFQWFERAGYHTSYFGKYMNGYHGGDLPGLTYNDAAVGAVYSPFGVRTYNNGDPVRRKGHQTHYVTRQVNRTVAQQAGKSPFFVWAGYTAPHAMRTNGRWILPKPPAGYRKFRRPGHATPPAFRKPTFNARNAVYPQMRRLSRNKFRQLHGARVRSLYAVDDSVRTIVRNLKRQGVYRDTILVFASDNGLGMGAHRVNGKNWAYQDVVRVPLLMRGPDVPHKKVRAVTTLVDVPGTLARLSGVIPMRPQDGGDLFRQRLDRAVLIQGGSDVRQWQWRGVYTRRYTFVRYHDGEVELYDRVRDPHEMHRYTRGPRVRKFRDLLARLEPCQGPLCQQRFPSR